MSEPIQRMSGNRPYYVYGDVPIEWLIERMAGDPEPFSDETWDEVIKTTGELKLLQANWDGEGSDAPNHDSIDAMVRFLNALRNRRIAPPGAVYAHAVGQVFADWHIGWEPGKVDWKLVSVEVIHCKPNVAEVLVSYGPSKPSEFGDITIEVPT